MSSNVALIFGANGQDGYYLSEHLRSAAIAAIGISRSGDFLHADVSNFEQVESLVKQHRPAYIFHLAANSTTRHEAILDNQAAIVSGTLNLLESVKRHSPACRVFITGSGVQFRNEGRPISETDPFANNSAYALCRNQSVEVARYYRSLGLAVYIGFLFHHESPLRNARHLSQLIATAARQGTPITIGDLSVGKEWTFAGDTTRAMLVLLQQPNVFEAVIGSGVAHSIQEWLEACFSAAGRDWKKYVQIEEGFMPEYNLLLSNPGTIRSLGWSPAVGFQELARMMVDGSLR